jgi:hypothetical protein
MRNDIFYEEKVWITTLFFFRKKERHPLTGRRAFGRIVMQWMFPVGNPMETASE